MLNRNECAVTNIACIKKNEMNMGCLSGSVGQEAMDPHMNISTRLGRGPSSAKYRHVNTELLPLTLTQDRSYMINLPTWSTQLIGNI